MLVVFPNSLNYDTNQTPTYYEDHLLERVSVLELRHSQMSEALRGVVEILREQSQIMKDERDLIKQLYGMLGLVDGENEAKPVPDLGKIVADVKRRADADDAALDAVLAEHRGPRSDLLAKLFIDGLLAWDNYKERAGFQIFDQALAMSPRNVALHRFVLARLVASERFPRAIELAHQLLALVPDDRAGRLLGGIAYAELHQFEESRRLMSLLANEPSTLMIVNSVWALSAAYSGNWTECVAAFKQATSMGTHAELEYLIGCAYFQLGRLKMALRHFEMVRKCDREFADARFMESVIFRRRKERVAEAEARELALSVIQGSDQCHEFIHDPDPVDLETALPYRHFANPRAYLISGGAHRLRKYFRRITADALRDIEKDVKKDGER